MPKPSAGGMKLVDLKMSKADMKDDMCAPAAEANPYPWGLKLDLDGDVLDKLGLDCKVGDEIHIIAIAKCTSCSENATEDRQSRSIGLQITDMAVGAEAMKMETKEPAKAERKEVGAKSALTHIYRGQ